MMKQQSILSKLFGFILKQTKPKYMDFEIETDKFIFKKECEKEKNNYNNITFGNPESNNIILYIHGGAYINDLNLQHKLYCFFLSKITNSYVILPSYPLAPKHTYDETYLLITNLYKELLKLNKNIAVMGDSAGGGFAISFCQYLKSINLPQPKHLIVFSPWVDLSMSGEGYDIEDPVLGKIGLEKIGKRWAGNLDTQNYKVSPLFGDNSNLAKSLIFVGSQEIFYSDVKKYYQKLKESNVDVRLIVGHNLFHVYPMFPIPEALSVFREIKKELND